MANISTSIQLYDKISAPIYKMLAALDNLTGAFESVDSSMDGGFDSSKIEEARRQTEQAAQEVVQLGEEIEDNTESQEGFNKSVRSGSSDMGGLTNKVMGLVGAYMSLQTVTKALELSDTMTQTTARLDMMNDGLQSTEQLQQMIFNSAQRSRGSYQDSADAVAKMGIMAKDAFKSNGELVAFVEQLNKQFTIAGTSQEGVSSAMLQLTQAMSSGVLRGEELNSVFEQAPTIIQAIADYMNVPIGKIRDMAQEGQISSAIVKNALLSATEETNAKFEQMPMTWGQVFTSIKNQALMSFQPVLNKINKIANNQQFQNFATNAVGMLSIIAMCLVDIMDFAGAIVMFISDNWTFIAPVIWGIVAALGAYAIASAIVSTMNTVHAISESVKAAKQKMATGATLAETAAQYGLNAALLACPLTWILVIIIAVIAAIYAAVAAINKITGSSISATGIIVGALTTAVAFIWNLFLSLLDLVLGIVSYMVNPWIAFANFFGNLFNDPIGAIVHLFGDMADNILGLLESIAKALDKVFGSNLASAVQGWRSGLSSMVESVANEYGNGSYEKVMDGLNLSSDSLGLKRWAYTDAWDTGYAWGESIENSMSGLFGGENNTTSYDAEHIGTYAADIASNTGKTADALEITNEDLKYMRDIAERDVINRFTTAEIKVDMTNNNTINKDMDLDGVVDYLATGVNEAMERAAEGVHE